MSETNQNDKKYVFIATHDNRLQCFFNKLIHDNKLKVNMKRFKNCAIIHFTCNQNKVNINMVYEGDIDTSIEKPNLFWTKVEFYNLLSSKIHYITDESYNNIEIFLIRHGKGKHNINLTERKKMGATDAFKYIFNKKKMNTSHKLIDAELTDGTEEKINTYKLNTHKLNGITNAIKAGDELKKYLESKNIILNNTNCILGASRLRRTRQTISYIMYQILGDNIKTYPIYIFPCVYEVAGVDKKGLCDKQSKIKYALAFENKPLCNGTNEHKINNNDICKNIILNKYNKMKVNNIITYNKLDTTFTLTINWTHVSQENTVCDDLLNSCYKIIKQIIKQIESKQIIKTNLQTETEMKQKYLKYKLKYLKLKNNLQL